jgi:hypothetical protein
MDSDLLREGPEEFLNLLMQEDEKRELVLHNLFARELALADRALKLQLQGFKTVGENDTGATFNVAVQQLLARLFNHQLAARKLLLMGYITEAASILARALETSWLARSFDCYPNEIERWCDKKEQIRPSETRRGLELALKEGKIRIGDTEKENSLYQELCKFGHPDLYGSILHVKVKSESPLEVGFSLGGYANLRKPELLRETFKWLLKIQIHSLMTMAAISEEFLANNQPWWGDCSSLLESLGDCCRG